MRWVFLVHRASICAARTKRASSHNGIYSYTRFHPFILIQSARPTTIWPHIRIPWKIIRAEFGPISSAAYRLCFSHKCNNYIIIKYNDMQIRVGCIETRLWLCIHMADDACYVWMGCVCFSIERRQKHGRVMRTGGERDRLHGRWAKCWTVGL